MIISRVETETSNTQDWQESGWKVWPYNYPTLVIDPPAPYVNLESWEPPSDLPQGGFELLPPSRLRTIDVLTHSTLLEQSMRDYGEIWKTLAKR